MCNPDGNFNLTSSFFFFVNFFHGGNTGVLGLVQLSQAVDFFFARKRESFFDGFFFARKSEKSILGVFFPVFFD